MCYRVETLRYSSSMFRTIDCCYVLTMEGSKRRNEYMHQLRTFKPCRTVHIQHNKGYKKCKKRLMCERSTPYDLAHAFYTAMKHAALHYGETPILICEDDFTFLDEIHVNDVARIETFLTSRKFDVYNLGPFPVISLPISSFHKKLIKWTCAHACVYSPDMQKKYVLQYESNACKIRHVDMYFNAFTCYAYYKPLCVQKFEATENSKEWGTNTGHKSFDKWTNQSLLQFTRWLRLDTNPKTGFRLAYLVSMLIPILLFMVLLYHIG